MTDPFSRLRELCRDMPTDLIADWRGTNHYELTSPHTKDGYWWFIANNDDDWSEHDDSGKRMGLLLDLAEELSRLKREGVL